MLHGGTNFGFMAGANWFKDSHYKPDVTSYGMFVYPEAQLLTPKAPIATKVVCFSRLLKCLRSLYDKQSEQSDLGAPCLLLYLN